MDKKLFKEIIEWQKETFPVATELSKLKHLQKEVEELIQDVESGNPAKGKEYADCFLLLLGAFGVGGFVYEDINDVIVEKLQINKSRTWGKPDADGVVQHIKSDNGNKQ